MQTTDRTATSAILERLAQLAALVALVALGACTGERGPAGPEGPGGGGGGGTDPDEPTPTEYESGDEVPELRLTLVSLTGASGPAGEFLIGDTPVVEFTLAKADDEPWPLDELVEGEALVSGPSFNYQRVLPAADLLADAVELELGRYRVTLASAIPATYPAPYNDTTSFGANGGELQGRNLLDGTYTLGLSFTWEYEYEGRPYRRVAETTLDFLLGTGAGALLPRARSRARRTAIAATASSRPTTGATRSSSCASCATPRAPRT